MIFLKARITGYGTAAAGVPGRGRRGGELHPRGRPRALIWRPAPGPALRALIGHCRRAFAAAPRQEKENGHDHHRAHRDRDAPTTGSAPRPRGPWPAAATRSCAPTCGWTTRGPGHPPGLPDHRARDAAAVMEGIAAEGGRAVAVEADLSDRPRPRCCSTPPRSGSARSTPGRQRHRVAGGHLRGRGDRPGGRSLQPVTAQSWTRQFSVDAMGAALMIAEFARRHIARGGTWGRVIGLTSGGGLGFPRRSPTAPPRPPR